jgi:hypothetical protein
VGINFFLCAFREGKFLATRVKRMVSTSAVSCKDLNRESGPTEGAQKKTPQPMAAAFLFSVLKKAE